MRRYLFFVVLFIVATTAVASAQERFPQGEFTGQGRYLGPENSSGTYEVSASIVGSTIVATYVYDDGSGQKRRESLTLIAQPDGSLVVRGKDDRVGEGRGRCDGGLCSYAMSFPGGSVMELIRIGADSIEKVGTKRYGETSVTWTETLGRAR